MARDPSLRKMRYFLAVAESGRVTQAAVDLNVSQSSITTGVREIEEQLGVALFQRSAQGMMLTRQGHRFLHQVRHVFQAMDEAFDSLQDTSAALSGTLDLAMSYTVAGYFMPPLLARFQRRYPGIQLRLHEVTRPAIQQGLNAGEYDLAVMLTSNIDDTARLERQPLIQSPRRLWVNSHHPLLKQDVVSLRDIIDLPYIMLTVDEADQTALKYWEGTGLTPNIIFKTSSVEAVRSMVSNGTGITILTDMVYRPWSLEGRRIEHIDLADPIPTMAVGLAWSQERPLSLPARAFQDLANSYTD
ncbi:LysR substrate-binding domain-containing protein [Chromohalobacter israelensis]|uniref:LysR substrate-binding domain-containing protein n=1 Tax=Chromohalobacter israelensis TaxID=141390 RepID=UPI0005550DAD|nr:LysR substrate-binding domain-containing protein [Chromohalobacter israelensis]MDF9433371.1 LysR substrate-binding domain-containing protein [Chromohalobacter israelensis]